MSEAEKAAAEAAKPADTSVQAPPAKADDQNPAWLPDRLERAKNAGMSEVLKALGVTKLDDAKAIVEAAKKAEDEKKTEAQRTAERIAALEPKAQAADGYKATLDRYADAELAKLTDAQRDAVTKLAGGDKARALDAIEALRPTWASAAPATTVATPEPPKVPATTAPPPADPQGARASSPTNHTAEWARLREVNPFAAARYLQQHRADIAREPGNSQ